MGSRARFEEYTRRLVESVATRDEVEGLVVLGSTAAADRVDEWSDHDFYLVVREGEQEGFRQRLDWLPDPDDIAFSARETEHGLKVVYRDGRVLEFAVASGPEITTFGGSPYAVILDRADVAAHMSAAPTTPPPAAAPDDLRDFRLFLSLVLIGVGRARRGEELAGGQLVRTYAAERLVTVLRGQLPARSAGTAAEPDPFNVFRRFEDAFPDVAEPLGAALALPVDDCGRRLLEIAESELASRWSEYPGDEVGVVRDRLSYTDSGDERW